MVFPPGTLSKWPSSWIEHPCSLSRSALVLRSCPPTSPPTPQQSQMISCSPFLDTSTSEEVNTFVSSSLWQVRHGTSKTRRKHSPSSYPDTPSFSDQSAVSCWPIIGSSVIDTCPYLNCSSLVPVQKCITGKVSTFERWSLSFVVSSRLYLDSSEL